MADNKVWLGFPFNLYARLKRRADTLRISFPKYLRIIHEADRNLELDRAILVTVVIWTPILTLLLLVAISDQGKDLLDYFSSHLWPRIFLLSALVVIDCVATMFSTNLLAVWFFPRLKEAQLGFYWPRFSSKTLDLTIQERWEIIRWASMPSVLAVALPLAFVSKGAFGYDGLASTLVWVLSFCLLAALSLVVVRFTIRFILGTIDWSVPLLWPSLLILVVFGFFPVQSTIYLSTPIAVAVAVLCWLAIIHAFVFMAFQDRYSAIQARADIDSRVREWLRGLNRGSPSGVRRFAARALKWAAFLLKILLPRTAALILSLTLAGFALHLWVKYLPRSPLWMSASDGKLAFDETLTAPRASASVERQALSGTFKGFTDGLPTVKDRKPLVLVTAAGGGIRAAYWTAAVLTELQQENPSFDKRIFAISAVSGGSLGATAYKALTTQSAANCVKKSGYRKCAADFLAGDFVGPSVLSQFSGEVIKVLTRGYFEYLGVSDFWERDQALQLAWSYRWSTDVGGETPALSDDLTSCSRKIRRRLFFLMAPR